MDATLSGDRSNNFPALLIIERVLLLRSSIIAILNKEFPGFEFSELATGRELRRPAGRETGLIMLNIGDKPIIDLSVEDDLVLLAEAFPRAPIGLLSNRHDEATASAAIRRGIRGFFPTF